MKKVLISATAALVVILCALICACKSSDPIVGTYKLVTVSMSNGRTEAHYASDGTSQFVTENSFVLEIKSNYKWNMIIQLPGVSETEDGKWEENNGSYILKEDRDDPTIPLTYSGDMISLTITEDGYVMAVVLKKV